MRVIVAVLTALFAWTAAAKADVYTVSGVYVDATAQNAALAREQALADAQVLAAQQLFERLTLPQDRFSLPDIDADIAQGMVRGLEIEQEQYSGRRYLAQVAVSFSPNAVRRLLRGSGTPFVDSRARPIVVVPVWLEDTARPALWVDNPWLTAWTKGDEAAALVPLLTPVGDIEDIAALTPNAAAGVNQDALVTLAARYGADRALVARAEPTAQGAAARLTLVDANGSIANLGTVSAGGLDGLVRETSQVLQTEWKQLTVVRDDTVRTATLRTQHASFQEWRRLRDAIGGAGLIGTARLDTLSAREATFEIQYRGGFDQLVLELTERGVAVSIDPEDGAIVAQSALGDVVLR